MSFRSIVITLMGFCKRLVAFWKSLRKIIRVAITIIMVLGALAGIIELVVGADEFRDLLFVDKPSEQVEENGIFP